MSDDEVFAAERPRLVGLAYRMLGSVADAEDVVQEAWIRWANADQASIERPAAWLTTVVGRLGLDRLRAARRARVDYVGPWLPEPIVAPIEESDPAAHAVLADSLTTAFLVMLERLAPEERLALLLADVFGEPFRVVAAAVGRSEDATRQLAVRARRKLRDLPEARPVPSAAEQLDVATRFAGAVMSGDLAAVRSLLREDAVLISDGGASRHAARRPVVGADRIARFVVNIGRRAQGLVEMRPIWVNGRPGVLSSVQGVPFMVTAVDVADGLVARTWSILNPDKLRALEHTIDLV